MNNPIHIAIATDENYLHLAVVCLKSLFETNNERAIHVHLLTNKVSEDGVKRVQEVIPAANGVLNVHPIQDLASMLGVAVPATISITSYARLFLPTILPEDVERVLYIDCDILFTDRIDAFYDADMRNALVGGVHDLLLSPIYKAQLELPQNEVYFNAGVLLIPLATWRKENMQQKFLDYLLAHNGVVYHHDQGIINAVCRGHKYIAPARYNVISNYFVYPYRYVCHSADRFYSEALYKEASEHPAIIHFTGCIHGRPWEEQCSHPYRQQFLDMKSKTCYADKPLAPVRQNIYSRMEAECFRMFPFCVYYGFIKLLFFLSSIKKKAVKMKNKKVVIICPYLLSVTRGIERFCINLSDAMVRKGCEVIIYTWGEKQEQQCGSLNPAIKVRRVPYFRYYRDKFASYWYRMWLAIDKPDATMLNFFYHGEEYLPKNKHYLYVLHSPASQIPQRYEYVKPLIRQFADIHVVAISKLVEQDALPYFEGKPMSLIYNGTDTETFRPMQNKPASDKLRIITPAAFEERKGMHFLIEALADFKYRDRIQYDIYGSGVEAYGKHLETLIAKYHLENVVTLKGSVTNIPELEPMYDLFALLSKGEAFALSPIEAMACGLPILVSDCAPYPEFVKSDFGYMVNREDKAAILQCLTELIENKNILRAKSVAARKASVDFSWDTIVEQYLVLL